MHLRTISRLAAVVTVVLVMGGAAATVLAPDAGATGEQRVTLQPDQTLELDYPALVGTAQGQELVDETVAFDPSTCETVTWCDTIPLTVAPALTDLSSSDYTVQIVLTWDTSVQSVPVQGNVDSNDLDMAIWDDPVNPDAGPNQDGVRASSATGNVPESMTLVDSSGNFNIVVANASGVNHGYHLEITWKTQILEKPFESLPPDFSGGSAPFTGSPLALGAPAPVPAPTPAPPVGGITLPAIPAAADTSFTTGGPSDFNSQLRNPSLATAQPASVKRNLHPPSNLALLLWLIALPFGLTAIGGQLLLGRSRALLRI